jgi:streptogramin lyase
VDGAGNVFVSDAGAVRRVSPTGDVTPFAGAWDQHGSADATGPDARFDLPAGLAAGPSGEVYVADCGNHAVRRISPEGVVTTLAGAAGQPGSDDGTGSAARFECPDAVAVDGAGFVWVVDETSATVRRISPAREVVTVAGTAGQYGSDDGTGGAARFSSPRGIAVDGSGVAWVTDADQTLRRVTADGVVTTVAGSPGQEGSQDGAGPEARFDGPAGLAVGKAGQLLVADTLSFSIRAVTPAGVVTTFAGMPGQPGSADGAGPAARFQLPAGVAVDASGNAFVADSYNFTIRKITPAGEVTTVAGVAGDSGPDDGPAADARFAYPSDLALGPSGELYVVSWDEQTVRKVTPDGQVSTLAGQAFQPGSDDGTGSTARFRYPQGVAVDAAGTVYVADCGNDTIREITPAGAVTTLAGTAGAWGSDDGAGAAARFSSPTGVAVDAAGNVYVADGGNFTIRRIAPGGEVSTLAGAPGQEGSLDGTGAGARFGGLAGLALDGAGDLYVVDQGNATIRKVTPAGEVTTVVGVAGRQGNLVGELPAGLASPGDVAVDPATGHLLVTVPDAVLVASP